MDHAGFHAMHTIQLIKGHNNNAIYLHKSNIHEINVYIPVSNIHTYTHIYIGKVLVG